MKTVTKEDVEQWHDAVHALVQAWAPNSDTRTRVEPILARLRDTAAQVPVLIADNAALGDALWRAEAECQRRIEGGPWSPEGEAHLNALVHILQPAALAWSEKRIGKELRDEARTLRTENAALQARVAELERERDAALEEASDLRTSGSTEQQMREAAESERDALCARVDGIHAYLTAEHAQHMADAERAGKRGNVVHILKAQVITNVLRSLSTPPAEAKTAEPVLEAPILCDGCRARRSAKSRNAMHRTCGIPGCECHCSK